MTRAVTGEISESEAENIYNFIAENKMSCPATGSTDWNVHWRLVVMANMGSDPTKEGNIPMIMVNNNESGYTMFFAANFFRSISVG